MARVPLWSAIPSAAAISEPRSLKSQNSVYVARIIKGVLVTYQLLELLLLCPQLLLEVEDDGLHRGVGIEGVR